MDVRRNENLMNLDMIGCKKLARQSWLLKVLKYFSEMGFSVVMTSDHGSMGVQNDVMVSADKLHHQV